MKTVSIHDNSAVKEIAQKVLDAHKIVIITGMSPGINSCSPFDCYAGAGISVSAGLPAFHGKEGLYSTKSLPFCSGYKGNVEELFHVSVLGV